MLVDNTGNHISSHTRTPWAGDTLEGITRNYISSRTDSPAFGGAMQRTASDLKEQ